LYTSCVLGLRPFALFNEFLLIKKKVRVCLHPCYDYALDSGLFRTQKYS